METEIWKDIPGYEGIYKISSLGKIFSIYRNREISTYTKDNYYKRATLTKGKIKNYFSVHRLVAKAFIPNPENKPQVNHINGIKDDNRLENLEWATYSENMIHAYRILGNKSSQKGKFGQLSSRGKKVGQYTLDGKFIQYFGSTREVDRVLGFSRTGISDCCIGKVNKSNGFIWRYE